MELSGQSMIMESLWSSVTITEEFYLKINLKCKIWKSKKITLASPFSYMSII